MGKDEQACHTKQHYINKTFFSEFSLMLCVCIDICGNHWYVKSEAYGNILQKVVHFDTNIGEKLQMWSAEYYTVVY